MFYFSDAPQVHNACFKRNVDSANKDITHYENVVSPHDCQDLCKGHKECSYFVFDTKKLNCWLKREIAKHLTSYDGAIFGPKQCGKVLVYLKRTSLIKSKI